MNCRHAHIREQLFLKKYLKTNEFIEVDSLRNRIRVPTRFEKYINGLADAGLDIGKEIKNEFGYIESPPIQMIQKTRKLYVFRRK
jgi:hypothetical protein